jgi:tRNA(Ile)-lysidine synthase
MEAVDQFVKRHKLIEANTTVIVGVSGGPDSMALLRYLISWQDKLHLTIVAAHVDHSLRGAESQADFEYVKSYCEKRSIPFEAEKVDVVRLKKKEQLSTQVAARHLRYEFFAKVMEKYNAKYLALGHHGDDQVETMLMNQVRGNVGNGLSGIPFRRPFATGSIIRPFLSITKERIEQYCKEENIIPRRDHSNDSDDYMRNRFRKHILPLLKEENSNVHTRMQLQSEMIQHDQVLLEQLAVEKLDECIVKKNNNEILLAVDKFAEVAFPLQRRMIHLILKYLYGQYCQNLSFVHIQQTMDLLSSEHPSGELNLPNEMVIKRSYSLCSFSLHKVKREEATLRQLLPVPGEVKTPLGTIKAEVTEMMPTYMNDKMVFASDSEKLSFPLVVRARANGDRMTMKGSGGTKKLKSIFIDEKIDKELRDCWPIVEDSSGEIIWIPAIKLSTFATVSPVATKYVVLHFNYSKQQRRRKYDGL